MDPELIGQMMDLTTRTWVSQAVSVAAELGVADTLAEGPRHVDDIARTVGADADALYRLLRALSDLDLFRELEGAGSPRPRSATCWAPASRARSATGRS